MYKNDCRAAETISDLMEEQADGLLFPEHSVHMGTTLGERRCT